MATQTEIIAAMQFSIFGGKNPINETGDSRYTITYQYAGTSAPSDLPTSSSFTGWTNFTNPEQTAFEDALTHIESFLNVTFVETFGSADPDLNVGKVTLPGSTAGYGGTAIGTSGASITRWDGFVVYDNTINLSQASQFDLILHELGHALGLKHPFSGSPTLPSATDSNKYTIMAYSANPDNGQDSDAMMLYDILALQDIWGSVAYNSGNTTYTGPRTNTVDAVWDTGGLDTFDASAKTSPVALDLRPGAFSTFGSYPDVVIAFGTRIENAKGGMGNDQIIGNGSANEILGHGGNDDLRGGGNNDILSGGDGKDKLKGGSGDDILSGGKHRDILIGQNGDDILIGNAGRDKFVFKRGYGNDTVNDLKDDVDQLQITGLGNKSQIVAQATEIGDDVFFDFGADGTLTVLNSTIAQLSDDILA